ncbi:MAG: 2,3-diaminopropionate biosynthesis protein SbnB [Nostoc sp.]|uniref:2,3-diaminopropionate biosynthesis protein SbnB n=1 Tax=Nostoc sp. TaxID=1180 RepID=UPI002FF99BC4
MTNSDIILLNGDEITELFKNREQEIMQTVKLAYQMHSRGYTTLPHSSFLRFPNNEKDRIIALPAYLGGEFDTAGMKWIASFPGNLALGMERASAVLLLNSTQTGHLQAIMESSVISAKRTAASAALAAHYLGGEQLLATVGIIGCGLINFETVRFLLAARPEITNLFIYDLSLERAEKFKIKCQQLSEQVEITILESLKAIFKNVSVISFATTVIKPHIFDILEWHNDNGIILHISLRDLSPEIMVLADNIVDDIDHVCRAQTSIHLTEQQIGNRDFIRCTIGEILNGIAPPRQKNKTAIFSPFGLGILDLALGQLAHTLALEQNKGTMIKSLLPVPWLQQEEK